MTDQLLISRGEIVDQPCPNCNSPTLRVDKPKDALFYKVSAKDFHCDVCGWNGSMGDESYCPWCSWTGHTREGWDDGQGNGCPECGKPTFVVGEEACAVSCSACNWKGIRKGLNDKKENRCPECGQPAPVMSLDDLPEIVGWWRAPGLMSSPWRRPVPEQLQSRTW